MGWERRRNGRYYYRKKRIGKRVVSEYFGAPDAAELIATMDAKDRDRRELARRDWQDQRDAALALDREIDAVVDQTRVLTVAWLLAQGYHTHKGQWRRTRERK
jgi:hypothetical protein